MHSAREDQMDQLRQLFAEHPAATKIVLAVLLLLTIRLLAVVVVRGLVGRVEDSTGRYRLRKLINFGSYLVIILAVSVMFRDRLGALTVALGVAGAGVAFALQEVIVSLAGWVAIAFGNFYRVGDRIQLGGIKGDVIDIGVLRTTMMEMGEWVKGDNYTGRIVRISNSFVFKEPVFNYSGDFEFLWDEIVIPVKYGSDYDRAREILESVAKDELSEYAAAARETWKQLVRKYAIEDAQVEPLVYMIANDNWVEFSLRYVSDYKRRRGTKNRLFTRILQEFDQTNGRVAIASMTVHLVETPTLDVNVVNRAVS